MRAYFYRVNSTDGSHVFWSRDRLGEAELKRRVMHFAAERDSISASLDAELSRLEGEPIEGDYAERVQRAIGDSGKDSPLGDLELKLWWLESWGMDVPDIHPVRVYGSVDLEEGIEPHYPDEDTWQPAVAVIEASP